MSFPTNSLSNGIELKSIDQLLPYDFWVPQYQRGYRWTTQQVKDLLDDLWAFQKAAPPHTFYCLQPVIVKQMGSKWVLIDGQQRLTTIYILLRFLNDSILKSSGRIFTLEYETRPDSQAFLNNIDREKRNDNVDYYHVCQALDAIESWFNTQMNTQLVAIQLYPILLERTRVIWYQLNDDSVDEHTIFIRINSGKIPLTNAELIKALFLKKSINGDDTIQKQFERRQIEIATEWDTMESKLQNDEFWYFLNREANSQATRIEFVFTSLASPKNTENDNYTTFRYFSTQLDAVSTDQVLKKWLAVKNRFLLFEDWFNNRDWYHLIGYLITVGVSVDELVKRAVELTKSEFRSYLVEQIRQKVNGLIDELEYKRGYANEMLKNILLLFNVETLRRNSASNYRFPFSQYKGNGDNRSTWSLEHIHAQNGRIPSGHERLRQWLQEARQFVEEAVTFPSTVPYFSSEDNRKVDSEQILKNIDDLLSGNKIDKISFEPVQEQVFALFGEVDLHGIENLALLTTYDNSTLSNGTFPQKRARIIALEKEGSFIPIATRNVFLKYYTTHATHLSYWTQVDRDNYLTAIRTILADYLPTPTN